MMAIRAEHQNSHLSYLDRREYARDDDGDVGGTSTWPLSCRDCSWCSVVTMMMMMMMMALDHIVLADDHPSTTTTMCAKQEN